MDYLPTPVTGLIGLLDTFALDTAGGVRQRVIDVASESFGAEVVGIVCEGRVLHSTGVGADVLARRALITAADSGNPCTPFGSLGCMHVLSLPIEGNQRRRFVVARKRMAFGHAEIRAARAMVRLMRQAVRSIDSFNDQVLATERLAAEVEKNRRLADQLHSRHAELKARMLAIQDQLSSSDVSVQQAIVDQGGAFFAGDIVSIHLLDDGWLRLGQVTEGISRSLRAAIELIPPGHGILHRAIAAHALVTADAADLGIVLPGVDSCVAAPIYERGEAIGTLTVLSNTPGRGESSDDRETLMLLAGYTSFALTDALIIAERERALREAEWQASHDPLTGLANRRLVLETIDERLRSGEILSVLYIDVDRFKAVNDLYGHQIGDDLIRDIARRLESTMRSGDLVGRLAGDEFIVVCRSGVDVAAAELMGRRLCEGVSENVTVAGGGVPVTISVGVTTSEGLSGADEVINAADVAMYQAKSRGRNRVGFYDEQLRRDIRRHAAMTERLETAVSTFQDFRLVYQPIVRTDTGQTYAYEALLRWTDRTLGSVSPDEFIPLAEEIGLIKRIDEWVLDTALSSAADFDPAISLSVNVSPSWLSDENITQEVALAAARFRFPLHRLMLEVTERAALAPNVTVSLAELRALGVHILLDDFGTGYSSLAYFQTLEVDGIKLDRGFLRGIGSDRHSAAVLEAVVTLTDRLGALAIAEGVESRVQADLLARFGCTLAQGFHFGRPGPLPTPSGHPVERDTRGRATRVDRVDWRA